MLEGKNEIAKLVKEKKVTNSIELAGVLRTTFKEVIETIDMKGNSRNFWGIPKMASPRAITPATATEPKP